MDDPFLDDDGEIKRPVSDLVDEDDGGVVSTDEDPLSGHVSLEDLADEEDAEEEEFGNDFGE